MSSSSKRPLPLLADTHVHLDLKAYRKDRQEVIARAISAGVEFMVNVGFDRETSRASVALAEGHDRIYASVGVHPHEAASLNDELVEELKELANHPRVLAIGETGLDYYRDLSPRDTQRDAFRRHIELARRVELPLIIHNREALDDVLTIVAEEGAGSGGGVMHCFPGDVDYAAGVVELGFHVGIGGPVTYSERGRLVDVVAAVPLNRLLLETDAPWLTPAPHRGKRNEPSYVSFVAERVAEIRDMSVDDLARATTGNAERLFSVPLRPRPSIAYEMWGNLYLNITNRCSNHCSFCIRYQTDMLWGYNLKLESEPTTEEILAAIGDPTKYREVVFCGYGEPTIRLDVLKDVARCVKEAGVRVRVDTNGQGNLIWNRNIAPELAEVVDAVSVSLNAQDAATYDELCRSRFGPRAFDAVLAFARESTKADLETTVSVVDLPEVDEAAVRALADELGVPLRVRGGGARPGAGGRR